MGLRLPIMSPTNQCNMAQMRTKALFGEFQWNVFMCLPTLPWEVSMVTTQCQLCTLKVEDCTTFSE